MHSSQWNWVTCVCTGREALEFIDKYKSVSLFSAVMLKTGPAAFYM